MLIKYLLLLNILFICRNISSALLSHQHYCTSRLNIKHCYNFFELLCKCMMITVFANSKEIIEFLWITQLDKSKNVSIVWKHTFHFAIVTEIQKSNCRAPGRVAWCVGVPLSYSQQLSQWKVAKAFINGISDGRKAKPSSQKHSPVWNLCLFLRKNPPERLLCLAVLLLLLGQM